jgi:hypothetical protein
VAGLSGMVVGVFISGGVSDAVLRFSMPAVLLFKSVANIVAARDVTAFDMIFLYTRKKKYKRNGKNKKSLKFD